MSLKKKIYIAICSVMTLLAFTGTGLAEKTVSWKLAYGGAPNDPNDGLIKAFIQKIDAASGGRFKIKTVYSAPLGYGFNQTLQFLKLGLADAGVVLPNYIYKDEPMMGVMLPHGVLLDQQDNEKLFPVMKDALNKIYGKWGIELRAPVLQPMMVDWTLFTTKPVNTLEQLKGVKIRHSDKIAMRALNNLGVPAQFVDANEVYMALKTGVIDGGALSRLFALKLSYYEVAEYCSQLYPYSAAVMPGIANRKKAWAKLPDDLKEVWETTAKDFLWDAMHSAWVARTYELNSAKELKEKGVIELEGFSREDRIKIQKATLEAWLAECKKIGPQAVAHYDKVVPLLTKE